jgi:hypothetical protein
MVGQTLPVCPNLTASQRSNAGGTLGIRTPEHRSARSGESLGGAAAPPYLGGGVKLRPTPCCYGKRQPISTPNTLAKNTIRLFVCG